MILSFPVKWGIWASASARGSDRVGIGESSIIESSFRAFKGRGREFLGRIEYERLFCLADDFPPCLAEEKRAVFQCWAAGSVFLVILLLVSTGIRLPGTFVSAGIRASDRRPSTGDDDTKSLSSQRRGV